MRKENGEKMTAKKSNGWDFARVKKIVIFADLFAFLVAVVMISSWYADPPAMTTMAEPEVFSFAKEERLVYEGDVLTTELLCAENGEVSYESADESIALVYPDGTVKGVSVGKTTVTAVISYTDISQTDAAVMTVEVFRKEVPSDSDLPYWYEDEIFIINNDNPVSKDYVPELVDVRKSIPSAHKETKLTADCEAALAEMYADYLEENSGTLRLISTYRSYAKQEKLVNEAIKEKMKTYGMTEEEARESALKTRQLPGHSEHHSGLAIDFSTTYTTQHDFHTTEQGKWLTENAHKYGFILRYPEDKADITQINYEPWHFRYIETEHSVEHATYIYEHGICLEEYVELQAQARAAAEEYALTHPLETEE